MATHAVLTSASTAFRDLGLAVVDEEQRFGVEQRDRLTGVARCGAGAFLQAVRAQTASVRFFCEKREQTSEGSSVGTSTPSKAWLVSPAIFRERTLLFFPWVLCRSLERPRVPAPNPRAFSRVRMVSFTLGFAQHVLYLSATPIPRSLTLALYGDMEVGMELIRLVVGEQDKRLVLAPPGDGSQGRGT